MIRRYNRYQISIACLAIVGGLFCSWLAYLFFRFVPTWGLHRLGLEFSVGTEIMIGWLGLIVLFSSAYTLWKKGGGLTSMEESALYMETLAHSSSGGAFLVNRQVSKVTGTSHILSQLFLAGPLMLFNAATRFSSLIPLADDLERRMSDALEVLQKENKWQGLEEHPGREEEIRYLAQVGAIDFGMPKGVPRFKANTSYGN